MCSFKIPTWVSLSLAVVLVAATAFVSHLLIGSATTAQVGSALYQTPYESDPYVRFDMEAYDSILKNYWQQPDKYVVALPELFRLALSKITNAPATLASADRQGTAALLSGVINAASSTDQKKQIALTILKIVTYNLLPVGRNGLYSKQDQVALRQDVSNVNPNSDLYKTLGLNAGADVDAVNLAFKARAAELADATTAAAKTELAQVTYAHQVLTDAASKTLYDQAKIEPTSFTHVIGSTLYVRLDKISPTTLGEFARAVDDASTTPHLDSLIVDLRGNVGGALDFLNYFLGLFIGPNQYAFDLFHQGSYEVQRTTAPKFAELARYGELAFLTDNMTQSTAELTAETFKHLNLATIIGTKTRGWGTVENTFPLKTAIDPGESYALFLVRYLTVRDDNLPIQDNGVIPDIDTSIAGWKDQLAHKFRSASLIAALKQVATQATIFHF